MGAYVVNRHVAIENEVASRMVHAIALNEITAANTVCHYGAVHVFWTVDQITDLDILLAVNH